MLRSCRSNKCHGVLRDLEVDQVLLKRKQPAKQNELLNHAVLTKTAQKETFGDLEHAQNFAN